MKIIRNYILILIILLGNTNTSAQKQHNISTNRPRILIESNHFSNLKRLLNDNVEGREDTLFKEIDIDFLTCNPAKNNLCEETDESLWKWDWSDHQNAMNTLKTIALHYQLSLNENTATIHSVPINNALQKRRLNFIASQLINRIDLFYLEYGKKGLTYPPEPPNSKKGFYTDRFKPDFTWSLRHISEFGAVLIDWGYDAISNEGDNSIKERLVKKLYDFNNTHLQHYMYHYYFSKKLWSNDNYAGGHYLRHHNEGLKLVIALYHSTELNVLQQQNLNARYDFLYEVLISEIIPIFKYFADDNNDGLYGENEGNLHWGATYNRFARYTFIATLDLIDNATELDIYEDNKWVNSLSNQHFYLFKPSGKTLHQGDDHLNASLTDFSVLSLANKFNDPINHWLLREFENTTGIRNKINELIGRKSFKEIKTPNKPPIALDWFSKKTGLFVSKSSWDKSATMITLHNNPINKINHQQFDNNSFQIYKNGPLFIDSGSYDYYMSEHYKNYYTRTIAHNTITVHDYKEEFLYGYYNDVWSNDGGQTIKLNSKSIASIINNRDENYKSSWNKEVKSDEFTYFISDATSSFDKRKVKSYIRKFLFIKNLDRIVIIDYIKLPFFNNKSSVRWNTHFKNKPIFINKNDTVIVGFELEKSHIFTYDIEGDKIEIDNGTGGNASIKTLYPIKTHATVIGGKNQDKDYRYYIYQDDDILNGINYLPTKETRSEGANWRLEITKPSNKKNRKTTFLHTIEVGSSENKSSNKSNLISFNSNSIALNWDQYLYVFGTNYNGSNNDNHSINLSSLELGPYQLNVFDLIPNMTYFLKRDKGKCIEIKTNQDGVIDLLYNYDTLGEVLKISPSC